MSQEIEIELEMPFLRVGMEGTFQVTVKSSGMAYAVMEMVNLRNTADAERLTLSQVMTALSMQSALFPMVRRQLEQFEATGMVRITGGRVTPGTRLSQVSITESGRDMLAKHETVADQRKFEKIMVYFPGRKQRFEADSPVVQTRSARVAFGPDLQREAVKAVKANPAAFDLPLNGQVRKVAFDPKKGGPGYYRQPVGLVFDESEGAFALNADSAIDPAYLSANFTGQDILKTIPADVFELRTPFSVRWRDAAPEGEYGVMLPRDLRLMGDGLFFDGPRVSDARGMPNRRKLPEGADCDVMYISNRNTGRKIWFVRADASVEGFEGTRPAKLVYYHDMTEAEIREEVDRIVAGLRINYTEELEVLQRTAFALRYPALFADKVVSSIAPGDAESLRKALSDIDGISNRFWSGTLASQLEDMLAGWVSDGLPADDLVKCAEACARRGYPLDGGTLYKALSRTSGTLGAADVMFRMGMGERVSADPAFAGTVVAAILEGREASSDVLAPVSRAAASLSALKVLTGVEDPSGYVLDVPSMGEEERSAVVSSFRDFETSVDKTVSAFPEVATAPGYGRIAAFRRVLAPVAGALRSNKTFSGRSKYLEEANGFLFCMALSETLSVQLRHLLGSSGPLPEMVEKAWKAKLLDIATVQTLREFVAYAGNCMTRAADSVPPQEEKREWVSAVFEAMKARSG